MNVLIVEDDEAIANLLYIEKQEDMQMEHTHIMIWMN